MSLYDKNVAKGLKAGGFFPLLRKEKLKIFYPKNIIFKMDLVEITGFFFVCLNEKVNSTF